MGDIVVSDIDGTISDSGDPITSVISHLQDVDASGVPVYIVTARNSDQRDATSRWLEENNVPHAELIMSSGGDATAYKVDVAKRLLAADHDIVEWIENNPQTRSALADLGINVKGPSAYRGASRTIGDSRMATKVETRQITVEDIEVRDTGAGMSFSGYAAVFNSPSEPLPWTETIRQGAFGKSLRAKNNVMMLWSHDTSQPLASTRSKTLTLAEDSKGLLVDAALPQTSLGRDVAELLRSKVVDSMSFGFSVPAGGDIWSTDGQTRELTAIRLHEVSVVSFPAYPKTSASVRSIDILSDKTGADAEALSAALDALESGSSLTRDQATMLAEVVEKLAPESETVPELLQDTTVKATIARLRDELDLTFKSL